MEFPKEDQEQIQQINNSTEEQNLAKEILGRLSLKRARTETDNPMTEAYQSSDKASQDTEEPQNKLFQPSSKRKKNETSTKENIQTTDIAEEAGLIKSQQAP